MNTKISVSKKITAIVFCSLMSTASFAAYYHWNYHTTNCWHGRCTTQTTHINKYCGPNGCRNYRTHHVWHYHR